MIENNSRAELYKYSSFGIGTQRSKNILKGFLRNSNLKLSTATIDLLTSISENALLLDSIAMKDGKSVLMGNNPTYTDNDNDFLQIITSAYMRDIDFITGAVSMQTLPSSDFMEVAFIGRSNVGKSSLINMISNRKGLAYTSKTPGKTAEFNYFKTTGFIGSDQEPYHFFLVDLPGVGYAQKSRDLRQSWTFLLRNYVTQRSTLRTLFHLVDSRHGLMEADEECLSLLQTIPQHVEYVIVLTKVDKMKGLVTAKEIDNIVKIIDSIYTAIARHTNRVVPVISTSSETRNGCSRLWTTMLNSIQRQN